MTSMKVFDLGTHTFAITTTSEKAQFWFNQGVNWCYGFNQEAGVACFQEALKHDPDCAMAYWGVAYAAGPFYNYAWGDFSESEAIECTKLCYEHARLAKHHAAKVTELEQQLIDALCYRFQQPHPVPLDEFSHWDDAYANAMRSVYRQFPRQQDVMALFVEAMMTRTPWALWNVLEGAPLENADTLEAINVCEYAIALADKDNKAQHPAILHLHIHLLEMSNEPERALRSADLLGSLCPEAGHLNHMPGHIYMLLGDYDKAKLVSEKAIAADELYEVFAGPYNFYTSARCHDLHLMMYCCMFLGQFTPAQAAAKRIGDILNETVLAMPGRPQLAATLEGYHAMQLHVLVRFGRWHQIVEEPTPSNTELYCVTVAMHHYAKGIAHAALKQFEQAKWHQQQLNSMVATIPAKRKFFNNLAPETLAVGQKMLDGELAYHQGFYEEAFKHLRSSVELADSLIYSEPWAWMHPPRHALAALLLEQKHYAEAEEVCRTDLGLNDQLQRCAQHPNNVWMLHSLVECLQYRGSEELPVYQQLLTTAQSKTDVSVTSSCLCREKTVALSCCSTKGTLN